MRVTLMTSSTRGAYETEVRETVEEMLDHYDVSPQRRREIEQLYDAGNYVEALDLLVEG